MKNVWIGLSVTAALLIVAPRASSQLVRFDGFVDGDMSHLSTDEAVQFLSDNGRCYRCQMSGVNFIGITLKQSDLRETDLSDANFNEAFVSQANLNGANMGGGVLTNGYFARSDFRGANLRDVDFRGSRLFDANFADSSLVSANLNGASLIRANLEGADLRFANLSNALLINITYDEATQWPEGFTPPPSL